MPDRAKHASTQALCHYQELCEVSVKVGADGDDVALTNSRKHVLSRRCEKNRGSLIGRRAMDGTSVLEILNFRGTLYAGFVHGIAEFGGGHKASSFVRAVPVQQQEQVVRVVGVVEESEPGLAGALALGQVGVECLLPAAVVRNLVADENVHHDSASQWFLLPRYRNLRLRGKSRKAEQTDGKQPTAGPAFYAILQGVAGREPFATPHHPFLRHSCRRMFHAGRYSEGNAPAGIHGRAHFERRRR